MRLREKTLLIVGGVLSLGVVIFILLSPCILLERYTQIEVENTQGDVQRALDALRSEQEAVGRALKTWASADSTTLFMATHDPKFIQANFAEVTFANLDVNLILLLAPDGGVPYAGMLLPDSSRTASIPAGMLAWIQQNVLTRSTTTGPIGSYDLWQGDPWLVASAPILANGEQPPGHGTLVFGRMFDPSRLERMVTRAGLPSLQLQPATAIPLLNFQSQYNAAVGTLSIQVVVADDRLNGFAALVNPQGRTGLAVKVSRARTTYAQGQGLQNEMVLAFLGLGLLMGLVLAFLLSRNVTAPVARLSRSVRAVGQVGDLSARIPVEAQSPELATLSGEINGMLDALQQGQKNHQEEEARYRAVVEQTNDCVVLVDPLTKHVLEGNRAFRRLLQIQGDLSPELSLYHLLPEEPHRVDHLVNQALEAHRGIWESLAWRRQDGSTVETDASISLLRLEGKEVLCLVARDLSASRAAEARMDQITFIDPLTGLANRISISQRLSQAMAVATLRQTYLALLLLDLDYFRNVNDTLGHQAGDCLLVMVAERLQKLSQDGELARLGGDEFALLLPSVVNPLQVEETAHSLQTIFREPFYVNGREVTMTASIGIALFPNDAVDPETLLKYADTALNKAKASGRNHIQFSRPTINVEIAQYVEMRNHLLHALERKEMAVYYQPQVDGHGRLLGAEALLRWNDAVLGVITPERFIPLAEETGLILPIGEWLMETVATQVKGWQEEGLATGKTWINLSARQLDQPRLFLEALRTALRRSGLAAQDLGLEITESLVMRDLDLSLRVFGELREIGLAIALDDFGTGYSSFSALAHFPIQRVKIDRSFLSLDGKLQSRAALLAGIVYIAHGLGLESIAEGVEKLEDLSLLLDLDCDGFQGSLLGNPMSPEEYFQLLRQAPRWPFFPA